MFAMTTRRTGARQWVLGGTAIAVLVTLLMAAPVASASDDKVPELKRQLKAAIRTMDLAHVRTIAELLVNVNSDAAMGVLIDHGLMSDRPKVEAVIGEALLQMRPGPGLDRMVHEANRHRRVAVRVQLCEPLALIKDPAAFKALLTALYDKDSGVVVAALEGLRLKNNLGSVPHLIKALLHQEEIGLPRGMVAYRIRGTLNGITGFDFLNGNEWKEFWDEHAVYTRKELVELRRDYINAGNTQRTGGTEVIKAVKKPDAPKLFGSEIPSQRVVFVIDTSISMKTRDPLPEDAEDGEKPKKKKKNSRRVRKGKDTVPGSRQRLKRVQREFNQLIQNMKSDTEFTIITFNSKVRTLSGTLLEATPENRTRARNFVNSFKPGNETWTDKALERAFEIPNARTIVLLSDGAPVRNTKVINAFKILDWVDEANRFRRLEIHTVGFANTEQAVGTFLQELSSRNNGYHTELE